MKKGLIFFWVYVWTFGFIAGTSVGLLVPVHKVGAIFLALFFSILAVLILPIKNSRSRLKPEVGSTGAAGDEDGAKGSEQGSAVGYEWSPPPAGVPTSRAEPPPTVQGRRER